MNAAWYEKQGPARDVLVIGKMPDPEPGPGAVRIRVSASGINPGDVKKRQDAFGYGMPYPRVIPHSDGAGVIDRVGDGVPASRVGERVWCYGAQSYRPFGTAAEYVAVPSGQAVPLPGAVSVEQGACLALPGGWGEEVPLGKGQVNIRQFITTLQKVGYRCPLCIEREVGTQAERLADVTRGIRLLRECLAGG
jgi:NADPH2:quinone reductase